MAEAAVGTRTNAEWGFEPSDTGVVSVGGASVGYLKEEGFAISVPREYRFLKLDQDIMDIAALCVKKDFFCTFAFEEMIQANMKFAWDNDAVATGVLTIDGDTGGTLAVLANTAAPNDAGTDTSVYSLPTAINIGEGAVNYPLANKAAISGINFKALGNASGLLGTQTNTYN